MSNKTAGIIVIGDEILSGRTKESNSNFIANQLIKVGIKLNQIRVINDNEKIIMETVLEFQKIYDYVFTTGGIGPTHDDITSKSISKAFKKKYCINKEAYNMLEKYYGKKNFNEGRKKMSRMPENSSLIPNPLTIAPGFIIKNVFVLPGVPEIMKNMFDYVLTNLSKGKAKNVVTINTNLFESTLANELSLVQDKFKNCSIGSYPYFNYVTKTGGVNIVVSSWTLDNLDNIVLDIRNNIKLLGGKSSIV